jgi:hypothetical protein
MIDHLALPREERVVAEGVGELGVEIGHAGF